MQHVYKAQHIVLTQDVAASSAEGRAVSNIYQMAQGERVTIILPSTTGSFQLWANNSRIYNTGVDAFQTMTTPSEYQQDIGIFDTLNPSFSAGWVNITNHPLVYINASTFSIVSPFRFLRLQGASVSGSSSGELAYIWGDGCVPGN